MSVPVKEVGGTGAGLGDSAGHVGEPAAVVERATGQRYGVLQPRWGEPVRLIRRLAFGDQASRKVRIESNYHRPEIGDGKSYGLISINRHHPGCIPKGVKTEHMKGSIYVSGALSEILVTGFQPVAYIN